MTKPTILLTGASGFVGRHVAIALAASGWQIRAVSRSPERFRRDAPELAWSRCDIESTAALRSALAGATAAVYLYHAIGSETEYAQREARAARNFQQIADEAGVSRIVYLGGIAPRGASSRHLESRRITGEILRQARATTIELRASMIIGYPSVSFTMIRDLAVRLPVLALPPWLDSESCPISICDVAPAVALATVLPCTRSSWYEMPGPERISHRTLLGYLAGPLGTRIVERRIAALTPALAALGLAALTGLPRSRVRELILGLKCDLRPTGPTFWDRIGQPPLRPLRQAVVDALSDETAPCSPAPETRRRIARKTTAWMERWGVLQHV